MANSQGPWHRPGSNGSPPAHRWLIWAAAIVALILLVYGLQSAFPENGRSDWDSARLFIFLAVLGVSTRWILYTREITWSEHARNLAIWGVVAFAAISLYVLRDDVPGFTQRIQSALAPQSPLAVGSHEIAIAANEDGGFYVYGEVNGTQVRFAIDTGASDVVLSPVDAERAGIAVTSLTFDRIYNTANGAGSGAPVRLTSLQIGPIARADFPASVNRKGLSSSLLGMTFLRTLKSFEISKERLVMRY